MRSDMLRQIKEDPQAASELALVANEQGTTLLMRAADEGDVVAIQALIRAGGNVHAIDSLGCDALIRAAEAGAADCCQELLKAGADASRVDARGWCAMVAALARSHGVCAALLEPRSDPLAQFAPDMLASDFARLKGQAQLASALESRRERAKLSSHARCAPAQDAPRM